MNITSYNGLIDYQIQEYTLQINLIKNLLEVKGFWRSYARSDLQNLTRFPYVSLLLNLDNERGYLIQHRTEIIKEWTDYYETVHDGLYAMMDYYCELNNIRWKYLWKEYFEHGFFTTNIEKLWKKYYNHRSSIEIDDLSKEKKIKNSK